MPDHGNANEGNEMTIARDARGFTMLEILITVGLIGVLSAVALPRILPQTQPFEVAEQARRIHTKMARLRARSIAEQCQYQVQLVSGSDFQFKRRCPVTPGAAMPETWTALGRERERLTHGTARLNDSAGGTITFSPSGQVDTAGTIVIGDERSEHTVRVLASGMTRWESRRKDVQTAQ